MCLTTACVPEVPVRSLQGWTYQYEDARGTAKWKPTRSLLNPPERRGRKVLLLRARLPAKTAGKTIFIPYAFTSMTISRTADATSAERGFVGKSWRLLDLKPEDANLMLHLRIHSDYHFIGVTGDVLLGRRSALIMRMLRRDADRFALAVLYIFLSLTGFYLYLRSRARREYLAFAIFLFSTAFYTAFYMRSLQLFIFEPDLLGAGWLLSLFIMPASMAWFMELVFHPGPGNILRWVRRAIIAYGVLAFSLALAGFVNPLNIRLPLFGLMICSIIAALIVLTGSIRRGDVNARIFLLGFSALAGFVLVDVNLALFAADSASRPRPVSHLGMFAFALAIFYILGRRFAQTYRDLARYSRELEQARDELAGHADRLEGKVRERTEELEATNQTLRESNRSLEEARETARADMEMAMHVQSRVLAPAPPRVRGYDIAFHYQAAAGVSGDFYDFYTRDDELLGVGLFDVSGHGTASGLITVLTRGIVNRHFRAGEREPLGAVMTAVNEELMRELEHVDNFVTGVLVRAADGGLDCVLAGHTRPLIKRASGEVESIGGGADDPRGSILGSRYAQSDYRAMSRALDAGDVLVLYTDALIESVNDKDEPFQTTRLRDCLAALSAELTAEELLQGLVHGLGTHTGTVPLHDDLTVIVLKKTARE